MSVVGDGLTVGESAADLLRHGLSVWGTELSQDDQKAFATYAQMLIDWNANRFNLTRLVSPEQIALNHFLDSAALTQVAKFPRNSTVIDIGTGAGFPGLAIKILRRDITLVLIESTAKKLTFCQAVATAVGLTGIDFIHGRAEEASVLDNYAGKGDIVTARAVAPLKTLLEWTVPLVAPHGTIVAWKGARVQEELAEAANTARILGLKIEVVEKPLTIDGAAIVKHNYVVCRRR